MTSSAIRFPITRPTAIDPYRAQEMMGITLTKALYDGLLRLDAAGEPVGNVARQWGCSSDGRTWRFRLRSDSRFSTGEPVTADSFVRAWNRAVDLEVDSETTYHLAGVRGYDRRGQEPDPLEVRADGPTVLEVTLAEADFEFDKKTLQPIFSPVSTAAGPASSRKHNECPVGNGPFRLRTPCTSTADVLVLEPNPHYTGPRAPHAACVEITILGPEEAALAPLEGLLDGRFDVASPPREATVDRERERLAETSSQLAGVMYLIPFMHHGPMRERAARFAINHSIDRSALIARHFADGARPAESLLPPQLRADGGGAAGRCRDPELARRYAAAAGLGENAELPLVFNMEGGHEGWLADLQEQVREVLGWELTLDRRTAGEVVDFRTGVDATGLCRAGWMADYPTADNILFPLLHSSCINPDETGRAHGDNEGRYVEPAFDALIRQARSQSDPARRTALYTEAEELAIGRDMALIPLWYAVDRRWYRPSRVAGVRIDAFGCLALEDMHCLDGGAR